MVVFISAYLIFPDTPTHDVLENLQNAPQMTVDVYLGKERFNTDLDGIPRAMLNGWLGSVPYQNSMTNGDLLKTVRQLLPVSIIDKLHVYTM